MANPHNEHRMHNIYNGRFHPTLIIDKTQNLTEKNCSDRTKLDKSGYDNHFAHSKRKSVVHKSEIKKSETLCDREFSPY